MFDLNFVINGKGTSLHKEITVNMWIEVKVLSTIWKCKTYFVCNLKDFIIACSALHVLSPRRFVKIEHNIMLHFISMFP